MKYLALNGFRHPLGRYFNDKVQCLNEFNWTEAKALRLARDIERGGVPTHVIGFSDGATAAVTIARHCRIALRVYAHSPMYLPDNKPLECRSLTLFRTKGDTTPTFAATLRVFHSIKPVSGYRVDLETLLPEPALPIRNAATFVMWRRNHQFHNCLPYLPFSIIHPNWL